MRLKKLTVNNFRQFFGSHAVEFSTSEKQNLTIIHGENGSGPHLCPCNHDAVGARLRVTHLRFKGKTLCRRREGSGPDLCLGRGSRK